MSYSLSERCFSAERRPKGNLLGQMTDRSRTQELCVLPDNEVVKMEVVTREDLIPQARSRVFLRLYAGLRSPLPQDGAKIIARKEIHFPLPLLSQLVVNLEKTIDHTSNAKLELMEKETRSRFSILPGVYSVELRRDHYVLRQFEPLPETNLMASPSITLPRPVLPDLRDYAQSVLS